MFGSLGQAAFIDDDTPCVQALTMLFHLTQRMQRNRHSGVCYPGQWDGEMASSCKF
jgi:hypothetical protein